MEVTYPRQLVYFTYLATPVQEGTAYIFFAMDHYSEFVFQLGVEPNNSEEATLRQLKKLMKNKGFKTSPKKPFTLMTSCGKDFKDKMQAAIRPYNGNLIIDIETTLEKTHDFAGYLTSKY
ncbi:hypothetical protein MKO06_15375 [Gramella sp. GC03-9]|uniref:Integrase catalytic domain-containing protein n=1 Tax=Christiangramia oceanisediminis TaxID=2920386 RepID=A0A9X2KZM2_9FLAO|nr:hypothetical protein [Gramella oceanisediminis]MCP9201290.1 hypothetical protein [Gramella oceanisediminis]